MPTYRVRAPNGRIYRVQGPAGATQKQLEAIILKAYPQAGKPERKIGRGEAFARGAFQSFEKVGTFFAGAVGDLVDRFGITPAEATAWAAENLSGKSPAEARRIAQNLKSLPGFGEIVRAGGEARTRQAAPAQRQRPVAFGAGRIAGDVAVTAPVGGLAAAPIRTVASVAPKAAPVLAPVAQAVSTAGLSTGMKAATPVTKAIDAALRVTAGAGTGVATSALLDEQLDEGAAVGAVVSMIPLVGRYGVGPVWDALKGRIGEARAAQIFRQALGSNVEAARQAFRTGGVGTASQILARVGIDADTFFATGQLVAKSGAGTGVLDDIARGQDAAQKATLASAAGGAGTRTAGREAAAQQRRLTTETATPIMQESLGDVNINTRNAMAAQQQAAAARQAAVTETDAARRLLGGADEQATRLGQMDDLGDALDIEAVNRQRGIVAGLEQRGGAAADRSLQAGVAARTAEQRLAELQAAGVQPLNATALSSRFRQMAASERANPERAALFDGFADEVDRLSAENGGILDAFDLYEIRKDAGAFVERALQGRATPQSMRARTAELVGAARPVIDDAIEAAGGARWREYLDTFSTGMDEARRIELSDYARSLFEKQPAQFEALMRGDRPDIVERFFGKGRDDIEAVLGPKPLRPQGPTKPGRTLTATPAGPSRLPAMQGVSAEVGIQNFIKNRMTPGAQARAADLISPPVNVLAEFGRSVPFGIGGFIERPAALIQERVTQPRTLRALERGFTSAEQALGLLDYVPAGQRADEVIMRLTPQTQRMLQQFGLQIGREEDNVNAMRR